MDCLKQNIVYSKKDGTIITRYVFEQEDDFDSDSEAVTLNSEHIETLKRDLESLKLNDYKLSFCSPELVDKLKTENTKPITTNDETNFGPNQKVSEEKLDNTENRAVLSK